MSLSHHLFRHHVRKSFASISRRPLTRLNADCLQRGLSSKRTALFQKKKPVVDENREPQGYKGAGNDLPHTILDKECIEVSDGEFNDMLTDVLRKIKDGMEKFKEANPTLEYFYQEGNEIRIQVSAKDYIIRKADESHNRLVFISPETGIRTYKFAALENKWIDVEDGHDFIGLFIRDLMRHAYGIPEIE